jgi:uroporphyrinogen decarboxylase
MSKIDEIDFVEKIYPVYKAIKSVSSEMISKKKNTIGFVGAPWTLLVYMINQQSPKKKVKKDFFEDNFLINRILLLIEKFLKIHIKNQIENGADVIQIFDSWAGLLEERDYPNYIYTPTLNLVDYVKSLNVPVICFPREIRNYKEFVEIVKPDAINIDYNVDPLMICKNIKIPVQGGLDPKILLTDKENLKKETLKYLDIFKDHPYIFNLGHGILPETNPDMVEFLIKTVKDY